MKHLLFILTSFRHGGTNKSLENLLSLIDTEKYQVDVFAIEHYGPYKDMLPNCNILPERRWLSALIAYWKDTKGLDKLRSLFMKLLRDVYAKLNYNITDKLFKKTVKRLTLNKKYDAVIAYSEGVPTAFVSHLNHPNKIAWIHCDYSSYMKLNNQPDESKIYESYKSIVCVSDYTKEEFLKIIPDLKAKVYAIHNVVNTEKIKRLSTEKIEDYRFTKKNFNIISVGRIDMVKRFHIIPKVVSELKEMGVDFIWYLIGPKGFGSAQFLFDEYEKNYKVDDYFIWLDAKENPYPYLANSDLLVITSESEACPYVLNEAKILGIPVLTTDYGSATEYIDNKLNGIITPISNITDEIKILISNKKHYHEMKSYLQTISYENKNILEKVHKLIEGS